MSSKKTRTESDRLDRIRAEVRHDRERQEKTYRGRALKMFPWISERCGRARAALRQQAVREPEGFAEGQKVVKGLQVCQ